MSSNSRRVSWKDEGSGNRFQKREIGAEETKETEVKNKTRNFKKIEISTIAKSKIQRYQSNMSLVK